MIGITPMLRCLLYLTLAGGVALASKAWGSPPATLDSMMKELEDLQRYAYGQLLPVAAAAGVGLGAIAYAFGGDRAADKVKAAILGAGVGAGAVAMIEFLRKSFF